MKKLKKRIDCLFVHIPKFNNYYKPFNKYMYVKYIPLGIFGMADLLHKNGYNCEIVHLGVEWIENKEWDLINYIRENQVKLVGLPLYWHYQSYDTIEIARNIKMYCPNTYIVLGGFTASFFSQEIVENYPFIDAVIGGDGELPVLSLVEELDRANPHYDSVPNLIWRNKGSVLVNGLSFLAGNEEMDQLSYANFSLLRNYEVYVETFGRSTSLYMKQMSRKWNKLNPRRLSKSMTPIAVGRGCTKVCAWCGGNARTQLKMFGRRGVLFRSVKSVIADIIQSKKYGFENIYLELLQCHGDQDYFVKLFKSIREAGIEVDTWYEQSGLPTKAFIDEFARTFSSPGSTLCLSRESFNEKVRKNSKDFYYTNDHLFKTLEHMDKKGISTELSLTFAQPGENEKHFRELISFRKKLFRKFKCIKAVPVRTKELEPGSLWFLHPEDYGIETKRRYFSDYYKHHSDIRTSSHSNLGYRIPGYFNDKNRGRDIESFEEEIQKIKCKYFCVLGIHSGSFLDPWIGRLKCNLLNLFWMIRDRGCKLFVKKTLLGFGKCNPTMSDDCFAQNSAV